MNKAITKAPQRGASPAGGSGKARVSAKTRKAIGYLVTLGCTQEVAAKLADMDRTALNRALSKPHAKAALHEAQMQRIKEINEAKPLYKALAWERAHKIAQESKDERVSLKAVELLTGEGKQSGIQVNVHAAGGYEFVPPNARVVDISLDQSSSDTDASGPTNTGDDE